jgi:hypothetical protein
MKSKKNKKAIKPSKEETIIAKVWEFSYSGQKCVTIPRGSDIKSGEYVAIRRIELPNIKEGDLMKIKR